VQPGASRRVEGLIDRLAQHAVGEAVAPAAAIDGVNDGGGVRFLDASQGIIAAARDDAFHGLEREFDPGNGGNRQRTQVAGDTAAEAEGEAVDHTGVRQRQQLVIRPLGAGSIAQEETGKDEGREDTDPGGWLRVECREVVRGQIIVAYEDPIAYSCGVAP